MTKPSQAILDAMRDWIADCAWPDLEPDEISELSDDQVLRGIARHYVGGIDQFILDYMP